MISHKIVHRESNTIVVHDEEEIVGGYGIKHRDRYHLLSVREDN